MQKMKNSSIELLRIISIFFIVTSHYSLHGPVSEIKNNQIFLDMIFLGNLGVIIFSIISGYVMIKNKYKPKKIIYIISMTGFYSIFILILGIAINKINISPSEIIKNIFPIIFGKYWYITFYCILYLLLPYMNKFLLQLRRKQYNKLIIILFIILYLIPTFTNYGYDLSKFFYILFGYIIGAYYKINKESIQMQKKNYIKIFVFSICFLFISSIIIEKINLTKFGKYFYGINKMPTFFAAYSLFILLANKKWTNKYINKVSSATLGVYIISDNEYIRYILWNEIFLDRNIENLFIFILYSLGSIFVVYISCIAIELIRKKFFEKIFYKIYLYIFLKIKIIFLKLIQKYKKYIAQF